MGLPLAKGIADILDVLANVDKFVNAPTAIIKARAELVNTNANIGGCVNLKVDIIEVLRTVDALLGLPYPFAPITLDPCASTCPNPLPPK